MESRGQQRSTAAREVADRVETVDPAGRLAVAVAIDGVDGVGKTTFADDLADELRARGRVVHRASIDDFHHPEAHRYRRGRRDPVGYLEDSFDDASFARLVLDPLERGGDGRLTLRHHDLVTDEHLDEPVVQVAPGDIVVVDGVFLHAPWLRERWSLSVFLDASFAVTVARAIDRDVDEDRDARRAATQLAAERYVPGQRLYLDRCDPRRAADVVVDATDPRTARVVPAAHALVIGGTGMLAGVTRALAADHRVTLVARRPGRIDGIDPAVLAPLAIDYHDERRLLAELSAAIDARGPFSVAVLWIHGSAATATRAVGQLLAATCSGCRVFRVLGSASADPAGDRSEPDALVDLEPRIMVRDVVLGFVREEAGRSRWLRDDEIASGVLDAIAGDATRTVVGTLEPWSARP